MVSVVTRPEALRQLFSAITENTFQVELGVADPRLTDYLADLLTRFVRLEAVFKIRDAVGRRLEEVADMMLEAEQRQARPRREVYRHIGDFTLFWSGVYPEALRRLKSHDRKDHLIDYCREGKRSYYLASTFDDEPYRDVLRRLSEEFELCTYGLNRVRHEWERLPELADARLWDAEQN